MTTLPSGRTAFFALLLAATAVGCRFEARPAADAPPTAPTAAATAPAAPLVPATTADGKPEVVLYVTEWCPYCAQARDYMAAEGVPHRVVDIEKDPEGAAEYRARGGTGSIPLVAVGQNTIQGWSADAAAQLLTAAGYE